MLILGESYFKFCSSHMLIFCCCQMLILVTCWYRSHHKPCFSQMLWIRQSSLLITIKSLQLCLVSQLRRINLLWSWEVLSSDCGSVSCWSPESLCAWWIWAKNILFLIEKLFLSTFGQLQGQNFSWGLSFFLHLKWVHLIVEVLFTSTLFLNLTHVWRWLWRKL